MIRKTYPNRKAGNSGTVIVESAISLMMFVTMLFGVVEAGRFMSFQQTLTDAAREGARLAVAPLTGTSTMASDDQIKAQANTFLSSNGISGSTITIDRSVTVTYNGIKNQFTRVTVQAPYQAITLPLFSNLNVTLEGRSLMRNETSP
jgi:Flp pilus assembly protein TadG